MPWQTSDSPGDAAVPVPDKIGRYRPRIETPEAGIVAAGNRRAARQYAADLAAEDTRREIPLLAAEINYPALAAERQRLEAALADVKDRVKLWRTFYGGGALPPNLADQQMRAATALAEFHARADARLPATTAAAAASAANLRVARRVEVARLVDEVFGPGGVPPRHGARVDAPAREGVRRRSPNAATQLHAKRVERAQAVRRRLLKDDSAASRLVSSAPSRRATRPDGSRGPVLDGRRGWTQLRDGGWLF